MDLRSRKRGIPPKTARSGLEPVGWVGNPADRPVIAGFPRCFNPAYGLRIEDDGKGFDATRPRPGRGMSNMRKRARDCQGELFVTALNPGTRIELSLPNNPGP
jgi:hypothetical protein